MKSFKEDAILIPSIQSDLSRKASTDHESNAKGMPKQDNSKSLSESIQQERSEEGENKDYFSYLNESANKESLWFRKLMETEVNRQPAQSNENKWFCGFCTIRKAKEQPTPKKD